MSDRGRGLRALRRQLGTRQPKKKLYLVCEGSNTEPNYFEELGRRSKKSVVDVVCLRGVGVPSTLLKKARELISRRHRDRLAKEDEVWLVFDKDDHPCFFKTIEDCRLLPVQIAYSNPCFEIWLLFHFRDFDAPIPRNQIQKELARCSGSYDRRQGKDIDFNEVSKNVEIAIKRAKVGRLRREAEGDALGAPCTTVDLLVEKIL